MHPSPAYQSIFPIHHPNSFNWTSENRGRFPCLHDWADMPPIITIHPSKKLLQPIPYIESQGIVVGFLASMTRLMSPQFSQSIPQKHSSKWPNQCQTFNYRESWSVSSPLWLGWCWVGGDPLDLSIWNTAFLSVQGGPLHPFLFNLFFSGKVRFCNSFKPA